MKKKLVIDGALMSLNEYVRKCRGNKFAANEVKRKADAYVQTFILQQLNGLQFGRKVRLEFLWVCADRRQDPDNICFAKKFILDALVKACIIENDGWKNIQGFTDDFAIDKDRPRIEVTIEEVENV